MDKNDLRIVAEAYIRIEHQLLALPGTKIEDLTEVASHPMALLQCKDFFANQPHIKLIEDADTAEVAQRIAEKHISGLGAIASKTAAQQLDSVKKARKTAYVPAEIDILSPPDANFR